MDGYKGIDPESVGIFDTRDIKYFLISFKKANGSIWRITARVFKNSSIVIIDKEELISGP